LGRHGSEGERAFYGFATALDAKISSGAALDDAALLTALLVPVARAEPEPDGGRPSVAQDIEELISGLVRTARLPRRIAERCRMLLLAQRTLSGERRRKGSLAGSRRHPVFEDALEVFEISVEATVLHRGALEAWRSGGAPDPLPAAEAPRKKQSHPQTAPRQRGKARPRRGRAGVSARARGRALGRAPAPSPRRLLVLGSG
jgi:poly(A) polymerase